MGLFGLPDKNQPSNEEAKMIEKQMSASQQQQVIANTTDPNADITYFDQGEKNADLIRWQQDLKSELDALEHDLLREYWDSKEGRWVKLQIINDDNKLVDMPPMCNKTCIQMIRTTIRPLISRNLIMSNFSEDRILDMLKDTMYAIVINLGLNHEMYEIQFRDISIIDSTIMRYIAPAAFRSMNNGERKHLDTINRRIETFSETGNIQQKKGLATLFGS